MTIDLLSFHVDTLRIQSDYSQILEHSIDMETSLPGLMILRHQVFTSMESDINSATTMKSIQGWADVTWLCQVGFGCICGEDCDE